MRVLQPAGFAPPKGYANGIACEGGLVFVSGQIGWDAQHRMVSTGLADQVRRVGWCLELAKLPLGSVGVE